MPELFKAFGKTNKTCLTCHNRKRWQCGTKIIQYCSVRHSNRTENGLLKIKCKDEACFKYEGDK